MKKGESFTLIELLVVMAIIGLLASIVMVSLKGARERAQLAKTASWARSVFGQLGADAVGIWNFNDCCPGNTCTDLSAYSNHGTTSGGVGCTDGVPGFTGKALYFDGDDYVDCGNKPSLDFSTNDFTVEVWAKAVGGTFGRGIINKGGWDSIGYSIQQAYSPANTYYFVARDSVGYKYVNLSLYETWNWTHIVGIKTTNHLEAWVNGKKSVNIMAPSVL